MKHLLMTAAVIGGAFWVADFVLDRFVIKSDSADPTGFILQAEGFGMDDVARVAGVGLAGALALKFIRR